MANYRKSFNFRNGVQVDTDNFIVNANGLVGIGTSIPTEAIDAIGNAKISGLTTTGTLGVAQTANFYNDLKVGSNVTIDPTTGDVFATRFVGDASGLTGIYAISTTGFVAQGVGLHTISKSVGIGTTNPVYKFQVGLDPQSASGVGITDGNIFASGIITATTFSGDLTGDVTGDLTGVASTATELENSRNFSITGDLEASAISFNGTADVAFDSALSASFSANTSGIITASKFEGSIVSASTAGITTAAITNAAIDYAIIANADVGIGTFDNIRINNSSEASLVITSTTNSSVSIGESVGAGNSSAQFLYTPGTGRLDINNYDIGGVTVNLHEGTGVGDTEGFNVKYDNVKLFEVTYDGKVGVNRGGVTLTRNFEVGGDMFVSNNAQVSGVMTIGSGAYEVTFGDGSAIPIPDTQNFNTISGISTFKNLNVSDQFTVGQGVTMNSDAFIGVKAGIGTTNADNFVSGISDLTLQTFGTIYSDSGVFSAGRLAVTKKSDGSLHTDDRLIPSSPIDYGAVVPFVEYGDFQVEVGAASLITENVLMVPSVGAATVGFGTTNGGLIPTSFLPGGNRYLTKVGINTYYARSIFDVGTASTTMNSYFIPPSLTQSEIDIVQDLWDTPTRTGYAGANKVTPDGLVPGGIVYNKTTDQVQVRDTASTFRNLNPIVAFGRVVNGTLQAGSFNCSFSNPSTYVARIEFSTELPNANYIVTYNHENDGLNTWQGNLNHSITDQQTDYFDITWGDVPGAIVWHFSVLQV